MQDIPAAGALWREERKGLFLWAPVALAIGIGLYFALPFEPGLAQVIAVVIIAGISLFLPVGWRSVLGPAGMASLAALSLIAAGFALAKLRTLSVAAPVLTAETGFVTIEGRLLEVEEGPSGRRMVIAPETLGFLTADEIPARVRLTWRGEGFEAVPGDIIRIRGNLSPPPAPVMPGAYDFARQLYFERIGGVGFAVAAPEVVEGGKKGLQHRIETVRLAMGRRIADAIGPGRPGAAAVCIALVTGKRDAVPAPVEAALRDAGLAHLLAISGLHMGLVAGLLFFVTRFLLVQSEYLALHYPVKKWAAGIALLGASGYLLISGAAWSTQRAFIMAAIVFIAILLDRRALSLRNVAIAALIILVLRPEALFQAGFQMSFAAVTVLIAAYEWHQRRKLNEAYDPLAERRMGGLAGKTRDYAVGLVSTSLLAGWATGPFAMFHFNRIAAYGLAGNLLAMPVMGAVIMPAAILGLILMPFGLDGFAWQIMAFGVETVIRIATWVSGWPGALVHVPQMSTTGFLTILAGGLVLCLMRSAVRYAGIAVIMAGLALGGISVSPDIIVSPGAANISIRLEDRIVLLNRNRERFAASVWLTKAGQSDRTREAETVPDLARAGEGAACDDAGCVVLAWGRRIAVSQNRSALADDCAHADVVIAQYRVTAAQRDICAAAILDTDYLAGNGTAAVRFTRDGAVIRTNREARGQRPWTVGGEG